MKRSNLFKRSAAMLLAGLMAVSMSACGGSSASGNDSGDSQASSSGDTHKLSVVLKTTSSEYWSYVIAGIEQAEKDFAFIHEIPGRKIILKGNHDYWWTTAAKFYKFLLVNMKSMEFIQPFRLLEIHIFDLCKYIQKCRQCSVQDGQLFCPQPRQCVSAGKPLGI